MKSLIVYKSHTGKCFTLSQTITAPWLYFAHDFLSNSRSHVRSRINRIFLRVVFLERKLGVSVFSSLFMWGGISPVENDFEWQSERKRHQKWVFLCRQSLTLPKIYLVWRSSVLFLSLIENCFFSIFTFLSIFDRESFLFFLFYCSFLYFHLFLFLSFHFFLFLLFTSPSPSLSLGNRVLAFYSLYLEEIPLSFCFGGKDEDSFL